MKDKDPIDMQFLKNVIGDDKNFEKELFEIFVDNVKYNIAKLESAINNSDSNAWYMASHALKGSSASIGAFDFAKILEISQKNSDNDRDTKLLILGEIKQEFQFIEKFIQNHLSKN
jgi:HPt (histidine-containing phosphotransfer) domain-containing protein